MISRSDNYVEYCREVAAHLRDVHDLALRGKNKQELTRRVNEHIVREVELRPEDVLVDIGCGDGTLLRLAASLGVTNATGLLATEEEAAIVRRLGLNVRQGLTDQLPIADESASVVVCNSVLLVVPAEKIPASLAEMYRIAKPGARVFIGEIPFVPGPPPEPQFATARETLAYLFGKYGVRTCLGMARRMMYSKITRKPLVIHSGAQISFHAEPRTVIAMAKAAGLELVRYWQHEDPSTRYNYLFNKPLAISS